MGLLDELLGQGQPSPLAPPADNSAPPSIQSGGPGKQNTSILRQSLGRFVHGFGQGLVKSAGLPTDEEAANDQAKRALLNAQAAQTQAQTEQMGQMIYVPGIGLVPTVVAKGALPAAITGQSRENVEATSAATKERIASGKLERQKLLDGMNAELGARKIGGKFVEGDDGTPKFVSVTPEELPLGVANQRTKEAQGQQTIDNKLSEFRQTDEYKRWKTQQDNATKMGIARLNASTKMATTGVNQDKAPASVVQTAIFAKGGLDRLGDAEAAMERLQAKGVFGSSVAQNKVEDWIFGKGLVDPSLDNQTREDIGRVRAALGYTSSAGMRAHTGRTSREIYDDFKQRLGANQDWSALKGAMGETRSMLTDYALSASDAAMRNIRSGNLSEIPAGVPYKGNQTKANDPLGIR